MGALRIKKAAITSIQSPDFDYNQLPLDDADFLRDRAAYINARRTITHQLIAEMGAALIEARERLPGVFLAWARHEFQFSDDTIENYMRVARNIPTLPGNAPAGMFQARALYKLAADTTPAAAVETAGEMANNGQKVDYETAAILADAPDPVKTAYLAEQISKPQAYALTQVYKRKDIPPDVRQICLGQGVKYAEIVIYLAQAYRDSVRTAGYSNPRTTWQDIQADDWILNGIGWACPLSEARPVDLERFRVDRQAMHILRAQGESPAYEWLKGVKGTLVFRNGVPVIELSAPLSQDLEGQVISLDLRIPTTKRGVKK